jgi:antitoxin component of RelBE/YafQ-DinJ toxin-antitoxin module
VDPAIRDRIRREFPAFAYLMDQPEVGGKLAQAITEGWDEARLMSEIWATRWWKTTNETTRNWQTKAANDPAEANRLRGDMAAQVRDKAGELGISMSQQEVRFVAEQALSQGWDAAAIGRSISSWGARTGRLSRSGTIQATWNDLRAYANSMAMPTSPASLRSYALQIATGRATLEGVRAWITQTAKERYKNNSAVQTALANGLTVQDAMAPTIQRVADELEIPPERFSLLRGRGAQILNYRDPDTREVRAMTDYEAVEFARSQPEWRRTRNGRNEATEYATAITEYMGGRA